jgi:O-antigen ligase
MSATQARALRSQSARWILSAGPIVVAVLGPFLPLLIVFAGTLPASAPHVPVAVAIVLAALMATAVVISLTGLGLQGVAHFPRSLRLPLTVFLVTQVIALAFAVFPLAGFFGVITTLGGVIILIASNEVLGQSKMRRIFLGCYLASGLVATVFAALLSIMRLPPAMFAYEHGRASGTFLQPNEFAGYLLFLIPLGLAQLGAPRWLRILGLTSAFVGTGGLLLSVSRAAVFSLIVGMVVFIRRLGTRVLIAYSVAALVGLVVMATVFRDIAHDPSENASRIAVWSGAIRVAQRFALTGVGPFNFHLVYPALRRPEVSINELHAHDVPLQILIEDGVLGFAGLAWFIIAASVAASRAGATIARNDRERLLLYSALGAGFAASALQNLVDVVTTFLLIVAWPMLGLMLALGRDDSDTP